MRLLAPLALAAALAFPACLAAAEDAAPRSDAATSDAPVSVVELFTSQGCSSCPGADALLGRLAARDDVLVLSLAVDYWDYLGWKDTLASPQFTERQKAYKSALGVPMVYTPMMVVNGLTHLNGSDEDKVLHAIEKSSKIVAASRVPVRITERNGDLVIEAGSAPQGSSAKDATLWLVRIAKSVDVTIARGENRGKTITYHNVVRELVPLGTWNGRAMTVQVAQRSMARSKGERCAALLQQGRGGPIIGATFPTAGF